MRSGGGCGKLYSSRILFFPGKIRKSEKPTIIKNKTCSLDELKGNINYLSGEVGGKSAQNK